MALPKELLLSDLLNHRVRCNEGIDHGPGVCVWMHPPVHRILGWATRPSSLSIERHVWKLNQLRAISDHQAYVKNFPSKTNVATINMLPTLIEAKVLSSSNERIASLVDAVFDPSYGNILYYLVSRSDYRIPGTSRWRLSLDRIIDQQPGIVSTSIKSLDHLPLVKSSFRQELLNKSKTFRNQINDMTDKATDRLEGWLEDPPWDNFVDRAYTTKNSDYLDDPLDNWNENSNDSLKRSLAEERYINSRANTLDEEEDPWI